MLIILFFIYSASGAPVLLLCRHVWRNAAYRRRRVSGCVACLLTSWQRSSTVWTVHEISSHRSRRMDYFAVTQRAQCVDIFYFIATNFAGRPFLIVSFLVNWPMIGN